MSRRRNRGRRRLLDGNGVIPEHVHQNLRRANERVQQDVICDSGHERVRVTELWLYTYEGSPYGMTLDRRGTWREEQRPGDGADLRFWCPRADCDEERVASALPLEQRLRDAKKPATRVQLPPIRLRDL